MKRHVLLTLLAAAGILSSCGPDITPDPVPEKKKYSVEDGIEYLYDKSVIPEIHVSVSKSEWNRLLAAYDANNDTKLSVLCDVEYLKGSELTRIDSAAIRLRGNTSRRRPQEGSSWNHCHYQINFRKFVKDDEHTVHGARKVILKWCKDDPTYVREMYCYDLFRRSGVWTASNDVYSRLYITVEGQKKAYLGVYEMIEPIDERYLKYRKDLFGSDEGYLWKCRYGASLASTGADFGPDLDDDVEHMYELKTSVKEIGPATEQIQDFIAKLTGKSDESFYSWIAQVCDVRLLLKTYAVNVTVGMWDDYWNNSNNFYVYFNSKDKYNYRFYLIPYDYDNTLGTSLGMDAGRQDPFNWGNNTNLLIYRILKNPEFREIYREELLNLVDPEKGLFYFTSSMARIRTWQSSIGGMLENDTHQDEKIADKPASWGNHGEYRIMDAGSPDNFFKVRTETILKYCK